MIDRRMDLKNGSNQSLKFDKTISSNKTICTCCKNQTSVKQL